MKQQTSQIIDQETKIYTIARTLGLKLPYLKRERTEIGTYLYHFTHNKVLTKKMLENMAFPLMKEMGGVFKHFGFNLEDESQVVIEADPRSVDKRNETEKKPIGTSCFQARCGECADVIIFADTMLDALEAVNVRHRNIIGIQRIDVIMAMTMIALTDVEFISVPSKKIKNSAEKA